ncbi:MAG: DUF2256 domain-containing protein [Chitinophagaceae bacterium]|nr:DUF2256 domain-containing protein [Chitinophagaceae bacterium]
MAHKKEHLPQKICVVCNRPFSWRKKCPPDRNGQGRRFGMK